MREDFFSRYRFTAENRIGSGSFGTVFKARDTVLNKDVALKKSVVKTINGKQVSLKTELEALSKLDDHPNVAKYTDLYSFEDRGELIDYGVMEYCSEGNLKDFLQKENLSIEEKTSVIRDITDALEYLHNCNIVHRDIKPSNILISKQGEKFIPKITDFGMSKVSKNEFQSTMTNSFSGGTLAYASPEQLLGKPTDFKTDYWSLGVLVYEVFLNKLPFRATKNLKNSAAKDQEIFSKILEGEIPKEIKSLPEEIRQFISGCLITNPQNRVLLKDCLEDKSEEEISKPKEPSKGYDFWVFLIVVAFLLVLIVYLTKPENEKLSKQNVEKEYDEKINLGKGLKKVSLNNKWGVINEDGELLLPIVYRHIDSFNNNLIIADSIRSQWSGLYTWSGNKVVSPETYFFTSGPDENGYTAVSNGGGLNEKYGCINSFGELTVPAIFDHHLSFSEGLCPVRIEGWLAYIDYNGNTVIPTIYDDFHKAENDDKWDSEQEIKGKWLPQFKNGLAPITQNGRIKYINKSGDCVKNCKEESIVTDSPIYVPQKEIEPKPKTVKKTPTNSAISLPQSETNVAESSIIQISYDEITPFKEGLAVVQKDGKWGYIDNNNTAITPLHFDRASSFSSGLAAVKIFDKWGYINRSGNIVIPIKFDVAYNFIGSKAKVKSNGKWIYINKSGECTSNCN